MQHRARALRWAFFAYTHNYGDCSRAIEVARAMRAAGHEVHFFHRGGEFVQAIADAGFEPIALQPEINAEQHAQLMAIDQHRAPVGTPLPFSETQLAAMVESELEVFRRLHPDGVYCGLNLSCMISVPHARLPMITLVPTALCPAFFERGMASFPDAMDTRPWLRRIVPSWAKRWLINRIMLGDSAKGSAVIFNRVRARYGLEPVFNYTALVRGDLTLLPDLPELSGLPADALPSGYAYCGPIFARLDLPVPDAVRRVFGRPGLNVFCAMGSSGQPAHLRALVAALRDIPHCNVVCATTSILDPRELGPESERFFATRMLPAHLVNELCDVVVSHGGQGTVQTAIWAGKPVIGFGEQWEQQANLDGLTLAGAGLRIPIHSITPERVRGALDRITRGPFAERARALQALVRARDGAAEAVDRMNAFVQGRGAGAAVSNFAPAPPGLSARA